MKIQFEVHANYWDDELDRDVDQVIGYFPEKHLALMFAKLINREIPILAYVMKAEIEK